MRRVLYHRTTAENAEAVLRDKFCECGRDEHHRGAHGTSPGVWLSNVPVVVFPIYIAPERLGLPEQGTALLEVVIDATGAFMDQHEWKGEPLYREWLIPAPELNARLLSIRKMTVREQAEVTGKPVFTMLEYQRLVEDECMRADLKDANPLKALAEVMKLKNR